MPQDPRQPLHQPLPMALPTGRDPSPVVRPAEIGTDRDPRIFPNVYRRSRRPLTARIRACRGTEYILVYILQNPYRLRSPFGPVCPMARLCVCPRARASFRFSRSPCYNALAFFLRQQVVRARLTKFILMGALFQDGLRVIRFGLRQIGVM